MGSCRRCKKHIDIGTHCGHCRRTICHVCEETAEVGRYCKKCADDVLRTACFWSGLLLILLYLRL